MTNSETSKGRQWHLKKQKHSQIVVVIFPEFILGEVKFPWHEGHLGIGGGEEDEERVAVVLEDGVAEAKLNVGKFDAIPILITSYL